MRVAILMLSAPPVRFIGSEKYDIALGRALMSAGVEVDFYLVDHKNSWEWEGLTFNSPLRSADVLITHADLLSEAVILNNKIGATHNVAIVHNNSVSTWEQEASHFWDTLIYNSNWLKTKSHNKTCKNKLVLYPPIEGELQKVSNGTKIMLVNLSPIKGAGVFLSLALLLKDQKFLGVEGGWGRQYTQQFKKVKNMEIVEHSDSLDEQFKKAKVLLVPSGAYETWCMVATEAMAYGIPTITYSKLGGVVENLGNTGIKLDRISLEDFRKSIENLKPSKQVQKRFTELQKKTTEQLNQTVTYIRKLVKEKT